MEDPIKSNGQADKWLKRNRERYRNARARTIAAAYDDQTLIDNANKLLKGGATSLELAVWLTCEISIQLRYEAGLKKFTRQNVADMFVLSLDQVILIKAKCDQILKDEQ